MSLENLSMYLCHLLVWYRYIDDVLTIWDGPLALLEDFLKLVNSNDFNLTFTHQISSDQISFLDLNIIIGQDGSLSSSLCRKPTAGHTILHFSSSHPLPLNRSIPYSQYLKRRRNCSDPIVFKGEANKLRELLKIRGYTNTCLKKAFCKACLPTCESLLNTKNKKVDTSSEPTRIITNYH